MKRLPLLLALLGMVGCAKPPQAKPTPNTGTITTGWVIDDPLKYAPYCPEGADCTNADFVAFRNGKIIAYYQSGIWKKPNGDLLEDHMGLLKKDYTHGTWSMKP